MLTPADRYGVDESYRAAVDTRARVGDARAALLKAITALEEADRRLCEAIYQTSLVAQHDDEAEAESSRKV